MKENDVFYHTWEITSKLCEDFIAISNDRNPIHTKSNYAQKYGFIDKVVHGNILNLFISYGIGELLPCKNIVIIDQTIKYKNPLYKGGIVKLELIVSSIIESVNIVKLKYNFQNQNSKNIIATGNITLKKLS